MKLCRLALGSWSSLLLYHKILWKFSKKTAYVSISVLAYLLNCRLLIDANQFLRVERSLERNVTNCRRHDAGKTTVMHCHFMSPVFLHCFLCCKNSQVVQMSSKCTCKPFPSPVKNADGSHYSSNSILQQKLSPW